jgi:hypothetical protein
MLGTTAHELGRRTDLLGGVGGRYTLKGKVSNSKQLRKISTCPGYGTSLHIMGATIIRRRRHSPGELLVKSLEWLGLFH